MKKTMILLLLIISLPSHSELIRRDYSGFIVWVDCDMHGAQVAYYRATKDAGNYKRKGLRFKFDNSIPSECQPGSTDSYRKNTVPKYAGTYDIGHLVPANHLDYSRQSISDSFYITNTLPQQSYFNQRGAWAYTEMMTECWRDVGDLDVWAGVLWGKNISDDYFTTTHGIATPDYWWKIVIWLPTGEYVAWVMPNSREATFANIDAYLVSINELASMGAYLPDFSNVMDVQTYANKPSQSWHVERAGTRLRCGGYETDMG